MLKVTLGLALVTLVACSQCPNNEVCEAGQSCCQDPTGDFSCCPFHHGECCEDHLHCCPESMLCSVMDSTCINATHTLPFVERIPAKRTDLPKSFRMIPSLSASEDDITCPDGSFCPAEFSCLLMASSYGCCPVAQGLVCSDGKHCCPKDHECSADSSSCVKLKEPETVLCGDGTSECPVDTTCCESEDGQWGCCPMPKAVCCDDKIHCCPEDSVCDVKASKCMSSTNQELPMWAKFPARLRAEWEDHKPAEIRAEAELTTTRQITTAGIQMTTLTGALPQTSDVPCNDTAACPDGYTCCKSKEGGWACCPLPKAVCCADFTHCCPQGKKCNVALGTCEDPSGSEPWFEKLPVQPISRLNAGVTQVHSNVACDEFSACPDDNTCCKTQEGGWACCPLPQAVCCEDFTHCCPNGKKCNNALGTCEDLSCSGQPWVEHVPVQPISSQNIIDTQTNDVQCNATAACPDGYTCCKNQEGGWACCPLPQAVCCEDFTHCCPHGKKCNIALATCEDPSGSEPWFEKVPVKLIISQNLAVTQVSSLHSNVSCDDTKSCPDDNTCCKTQEGGWACCPLPQAVCCDDFIHCCPQGTTCNVAAGSCDESSGSTPWLEKVPVTPVSSPNVAITQVSPLHSNVSCDDTSSCPDDNTCCKTQEGGWDCCPLPLAVCCDDFIHCCPQGTTCNVAAGSCDESSGSKPWLEKMPVTPVSSPNVAITQDVSCDDTSSCPDDNTCCKTQEGGWACCPLPLAVCCDDFIHCCPQGTTCNVAAGSCDESSGSKPWLEKMPVTPVSSPNVAITQVASLHSDVSCDDTKSCPDDNTCCKTQEGGWACCPLPLAVCCDDFIHCCPQGTTCNVAAGSCDESSGSTPWLEKVPALTKPGQSSPENVNCDSTHACADSNTCCKNIDGAWGCCPLPEAVCCTDGEHCCPANYKCDVTSVSCIKGDVVIPWYNKISAQSTQAPSLDLGAVKCDEQLSCSADSTCCHLSTGESGCCPHPEAVCCPDQQHCCPTGYRCDLRRRSCIKTTWLHVEIVPLAHIGGQNPQLSVSEKDIQCGGGYSCQDTETCCPTSQTTWGCCPSPKAVCCDDMQHCCPTGYKCGQGGTCTSSAGFDWNNWNNWRVFFSKKKRATAL
ncbi:granulin a isoform X2 [Garra rufa]|uniref:granulin a isoform X2 n=1 Tax=Garra rufa TaxID=137080 RepID=UPI003CCEDFAA